MENIIKTNFNTQNEINYKIKEDSQNLEINEEPKQLEYKKIERIEFKENKDVKNSGNIAEKQQENLENLNISNEIQEFEKRFCIIINSKNFMIKTDDLNKSNINDVNIQIEVPKNVVFLENSTKKERKNAKNIFVEYLPIEEKIKLKKLLEDGEKIYSDYSINEIL